MEFPYFEMEFSNRFPYSEKELTTKFQRYICVISAIFAILKLLPVNLKWYKAISNAGKPWIPRK